MAEFKKEQLREHLDMRLTHTRKAVQENAGTGWAEFYEKEVSVLEIALAALTAPQLPQPAVPFGFTDGDAHGMVYEPRHADRLANPMPVYRLHPQPAVVKLPVQHWEELCRQNPDMSIGDAIIRAAWWNHCAAMLQGAEPVQGWIPCSERMPEGMISVLVTGDWFHHAVSFWDGASWCDLDYEPPVTHWMPLPAAPQQEVHFKTTSDERLMKTPDITGETVKVIGSFNDDGFCHKHPDTPRLKHPYMQLMVYPPRPATYCPKCEPHVAEWEERDKQLRKRKGV